MVTDARRSTWTPKEISRLGTKADDELAAILGRSLESVSRKRQKLEIEAPLQPAWAPEAIRLRGTKPDREVAKLVGRIPVAVQLKRLQLGIRSWRAKSTKQRGPIDAENIKLLFGPYDPPRRRSDKLTHLCSDKLTHCLRVLVSMENRIEALCNSSLANGE